MQNLKFNEKYDCIWVQWVLCYLPDKDAVDFLVRAKNSLTPNGVIILKENQVKKGFVVDKEDYSVIRSEELHKKLIIDSDLKIVK